MVTQTRAMARSASRSAFFQHQSLRHQTRSVVRATTLFKSLPEGTSPPPIPQPRTRKRRAPVPEEEDGADRPAKISRRAAPPAPPAPPRSPSLPPPNFTPPASPPPLPSPPPPRYVPAPVSSPTSIFPLRQGQSFKPLATPAEAAQASFFLDLYRNDFHGTPKGASRLHHYPGAPVPAKLTSRVWALQRPDFDAAEEWAEEKKETIRWKRAEEMSRCALRSPRTWLRIRTRRKEDPLLELSKARRLEVRIEKRDFVAKGHDLLRKDVWSSVSWTDSDLPDELGWKKKRSGRVKWDVLEADRWWRRPHNLTGINFV